MKIKYYISMQAIMLKKQIALTYYEKNLKTNPTISNARIK